MREGRHKRIWRIISDAEAMNLPEPPPPAIDMYPEAVKNLERLTELQRKQGAPIARQPRQPRRPSRATESKSARAQRRIDTVQEARLKAYQSDLWKRNPKFYKAQTRAFKRAIGRAVADYYGQVHEA